MGNHNITVKVGNAEYTYSIKSDKDGANLLVTLGEDGKLKVEVKES